MGKIDQEGAPCATGSGYPSPFDEPCKKRMRSRLGDAAGLSQFGVNLLTLLPGAWSSQRHWHSSEDEFVLVLDGEVTLVTDETAEVLKAGECAGFPAGVRSGHHLQNRSDAPAHVLEIGSRHPAFDWTDYPGVDLLFDPKRGYIHRDGSPYSDGSRPKPA